ncbi:hypothetical protein ADJ70_03365 [Olsenella sp. oral taxon 807]|uniref:hypothetical protein n=1 Tax=Olsenella sp. oral taxon 807 TaxID=712411 RepID=UPI00067A2993|nr:hypothetical protein [Olsenella sp. oral taxon 807]AKT48220.1 hypothetical protein ADJ70_03365 [Olsenella sp. oral taxon 807]
MSDERRDVARRLLECRRDAREYDDREADVALAPKLVMKNGNSMYRNVAGSLEEGGNFSLGYEQAIYRLADLIDPTCEANNLADGEYYCSECGSNLGIEIEDESLLPNYCPECGARVTGDEDEG